MSVAGKTGTLTDGPNGRFYTWFTGFAPSRPVVVADGDAPATTPPRQVSIGVLVVNGASWTVKANVVAREVLRAYFAEQKVPGVTMPAQRDPPQPSTTPATKHRRQRGS